MKNKQIAAPCWRALAAACALVLSACGGGGSSTVPVPVPVPVPPALVDQAYTDPLSYSNSADAALAAGDEHAALVHLQQTLDGRAISYSATSGHLTASDVRSGRPSASFFYVAYTGEQQDPATRALTFFYNGGPGSASLWLHMGSFGPKRMVTNIPSTVMPAPAQLVENPDSLLDTTDMVFVDAIGTGYSQAIAPNTNASFWGTDTDAAAFRDFVRRYIEVNHRQQSPIYLFGESYGGPRTAVLANLLELAGVRLTGLVLQSPILDYNANCGMFGPDESSCEGYLPTYAAIGAYHQLSRPAPTDLGVFIAQARAFSAEAYHGAVSAYIANKTAPAPAVLTQLAASTGMPEARWRQDVDLGPGTFQFQLLAGQLMGRYDARVIAPTGSALAQGGDPSLAVINAAFSSSVAPYLNNSLKYSARSDYISSANNIGSWKFSHDGKVLPDTVPDLAAAILQNPGLKVLAMSGYYDLATPFYQTERDLARLGANPNIHIRNYASGHMAYLDNLVRPVQRVDLRSFYANTMTGP
ncbi:MAG: peptidase S10 [Pseudomonadota bacterium]